MDGSRVIQFPGRVTVEEVAQRILENKDQYSDIVIVASTHEGELHFSWSNMKYLEILGFIDVLHQEVLDRMRV